MYIGFYNYHKQHNHNNMLTKANTTIGDDLLYPFVLLAQRLTKMGHQVSTIDLDDLKKFDAVVFVEFPGANNTYFRQLVASGFTNMYLILTESPVIKPDNYDVKNHAHFKKIFTWSDGLIDNKKYFKLNYSQNIPAQFDFSLEKKEKLCAIIASNKSAHFPNELYSERVRAIRWFEQHHPEDFDLYGNGWDRYRFEGTFLGIKIARLNRLTWLTKLLRPHFPSYKGAVASKRSTYQAYQFSICYENVKNVPGYITEKIFDCFLAGCVPVYLGADNIADHVPAETFIDKRKFNSYEKLYHYLKHMPPAEYLGYLGAIKNFLQSPKAYPFSADYFANLLIKEIT